MDVFRLPVTPPAMPDWLCVPAQWRRIDDLSVLGPAGGIDGVPGPPWLLVEEIPSRIVPRPPELFLRELYRVDVDDVDALLAWCGRWGVPGLPRTLRRDVVVPMRAELTLEALADAPGGGAAPEPAAQAGGAGAVDPPAGLPPGALSRLFRLPLHRALRKAAARAGADRDLSGWAFSAPGGPLLRPVPSATVRFAVALHQALVGFFIALPPEKTAESIQVLEGDALAGFFGPVGVPARTFSHPDARFDTLFTSLRLLNELMAEAAPWAVELVSGRGETAVAPRTTVGDVIALEIASYLYGRERARRCLLCGEWFHHQVGRVRRAQNRGIGVKYCSPEHAHAAAQRAYRRRRGEKSEGREGGTSPLAADEQGGDEVSP